MATLAVAPQTRERLKRLPAFPPVAAKLLGLLSRESAEVSELAEIALGDAALSGRLMQHANSVEFGRASAVESVREAFVVLGIDRARQITATVATAAWAQGANRTEELRRSWEHSVATALIADEIARVSNAYLDSAYTAGILHDIGRLGLLVAYPQEYESVLQGAAARCLDLLDFERETFGADHAVAGCWLIEQWGLPEHLRVIVGRHHDPCEGAEPSLLRIIHVACHLADHFGYHVSVPLVATGYAQILAELPPEVSSRVAERLSEDQLRTVVQQRIGELAREAAPPVVDQAPADPESDVDALVSEVILSERRPEPGDRVPLYAAAAGRGGGAALLLGRSRFALDF